jgi:hypothetical protein
MFILASLGSFALWVYLLARLPRLS